MRCNVIDTVLILIQLYPEPRDTLQRTIRAYKKRSNRDARSFFVLSQVGEDIDLADIIFCSQRLDDLYGSSQTACEVDKQYASYESAPSMKILPISGLYIWLLLTQSSSLGY
jgi:hypothetical protein